MHRLNNEEWTTKYLDLPLAIEMKAEETGEEAWAAMLTSALKI